MNDVKFPHVPAKSTCDRLTVIVAKHRDTGTGKFSERAERPGNSSGSKLEKFRQQGNIFLQDASSIK